MVKAVTETTSGKSEFVLQTLERGLAMLEWVIAHPGEATVRRASQALELELNTTYRLVNTLASSGYLVRRQRGLLAPGPGFLRLWPVYLQKGGLSEELLSVQRELRDATQESAYLNIWDGEDVVLVSVLDGLRHLRVAGYEPGFRGLAHCRATGKAILANLAQEDLDRYLASHELVAVTENSITDEERLRTQLKRIRAEGAAHEYEELHHGASSIGAPLFGPRGEVVGGIAVSVPASRLDAHLGDFGASVIAAGKKASRMLGYTGPYPKNDVA